MLVNEYWWWLYCKCVYACSMVRICRIKGESWWVNIGMWKKALKRFVTLYLQKFVSRYNIMKLNIIQRSSYIRYFPIKLSNCKTLLKGRVLTLYLSHLQSYPYIYILKLYERENEYIPQSSDRYHSFYQTSLHRDICWKPWVHCYQGSCSQRSFRWPFYRSNDNLELKLDNYVCI